MVGHQIRLRGDDNFLFLVEKKKRNLPFAYMGVYISCKIMHSRMHIAMARSGLETKFLRRGKEIAPLLQ